MRQTGNHTRRWQLVTVCGDVWQGGGCGLVGRIPSSPVHWRGATVKTQESEEWLLGAAVSSVVCGRPAREGLPPVLVSRCACQGGTGGAGGGERWQGDLGWEVGGQEGR